MSGDIIDAIAIFFGAGLLVAVIALVVSVTRERPQIARRRGPAPYRVRGRSIRGWQASAIREIRRAGRQHGRRG
jgi:hypothetical protein